MATTISSPSAVTPTTGAAGNAFANDGTNTNLFGTLFTDTRWGGFSSLSIPSGATINGIEVIIDASSTSSALDTRVGYGRTISALKATNGLPGKTFATVDPCWGSSSDLWGLSWTPTQAAAIYVLFDWSTITGAARISFDHIQIRVTFTAAASGYGHTVNGVAPANIGKVKGVATANIGKIIGVD